MHQAITKVGGAQGVGDLRGCLTSRLDYGPFAPTGPHSYSEVAETPRGVKHPELDDEERMAVTALLCALSSSPEGRLLLDKHVNLDVLSSMAVVVLTKLSDTGKEVPSVVTVQSPAPSKQLMSPKARSNRHRHRFYDDGGGAAATPVEDGPPPPPPTVVCYECKPYAPGQGSSGPSPAKKKPQCGCVGLRLPNGAIAHSAECVTQKKAVSTPTSSSQAAAAAGVGTPTGRGGDGGSSTPTAGGGGAVVGKRGKGLLPLNVVASPVAGGRAGAGGSVSGGGNNGTAIGKPSKRFRSTECASFVATALWAASTCHFVERPTFVLPQQSSMAEGLTALSKGVKVMGKEYCCRCRRRW